MKINTFVKYKIFVAQIKAIDGTGLTVINDEMNILYFDADKCKVVNRPDYWTETLDAVEIRTH